MACLDVVEPALRRVGRQHEIQYVDEDLENCSTGFEWDPREEICRDIDECQLDSTLCTGSLSEI